MAKQKKTGNVPTIRSSAAEYLTYVASVGNEPQNIEIRYEDENIWLTQKMLAAIYDVETPTINYHIKKIFEDSELQEESVIRKFRITAADGKNYNANHYNLQMVIAVGFKVNSERAVQFRKWINEIASTYTIKGWAAAALRKLVCRTSPMQGFKCLRIEVKAGGFKWCTDRYGEWQGIFDGGSAFAKATEDKTDLYGEWQGIFDGAGAEPEAFDAFKTCIFRG